MAAMSAIRWAFVLLAIAPLLAAAKPSMPRFKWGQSKDQIYLSVMVRDLDQGSVAVNLPSPGEFSFRAKTTHGEEYSLDLELREDVVIEDTFKWEIPARPDKWGTAVFCVLKKANEHRWDLLVVNPREYKGHLDKDWTREDQTLEPEEEIPYIEDYPYVLQLTEKNKQKTIEKFSTLLVNVRYPWCSQCSSQDDSFVKAAKIAKSMGKKDKQWKKVAFAVLDAREERKLAREMGAKCDSSCDYKVFTGPKEEPMFFKGEWSELMLVETLAKYLGPSVQVLKDVGEVEALRQTNTTCLGRFASEASPDFVLFRRVAGLMRGRLVFAATFGEAGTLELWPQKQNFSFKFEGSWQDNGTVLHDWINPRSIPLLQEYDWQLRETYEKLELPLAKIWIDDKDENPSFLKVVRHAVRRVAKKFIGKIAFVELKRSTYSYELRDFGLNQPEVYPAFGIASNASYNAAKYGFEITSDVAESAEAFWKDADKASDKLLVFCEQVLAGTWPEAHESTEVQTNWTKGMVKKLVWKSYNKEVLSPEKPMLLEFHSKYRTDHETRVKEVEHLATTLAEAGVNVATFDASDNYLPPDDFKRDKYSSDTEWYWVPAKPTDSERPPVKKLTKPKKNADLMTVLEFAVNQAGDSPKLDIEDLTSKLEKLMEEDPPPKAPDTMPPLTMDNAMGGMGGMPPGMGGMPGMPPGMGGMPGMEGMMGGMGGKKEL